MLIERLKAAAQADLLALTEEAGFPHARGKSFHCIFHPDRTPSVWLYDDGPHCFSCRRTWDAIDLVRIRINGSTGDAIRWLAARYGISEEREHRAPRPRHSEAALTEADLFRLGFYWRVERYLELLKRLWLLDESSIEPDAIAKVTRLVFRCEKWTPYEALSFYRRYRKLRPEFGAACVAEAREFQIMLAMIIAHAREEITERRIAA